MKKELLAVLAVTMMSGAAFAMDNSMKSSGSSGMSSFDSIDANSDGQISRSEWDSKKSSMGAMGHSDGMDSSAHGSGEGTRDGDTVMNDGSAPGGGGNTADQPAP